MFNCKSGEERYQWMHKIASAVPGLQGAQKSPAKEQPARNQEDRAEVKDGGAATEAKEKTEEAIVTEEPKEEVGKVKQEAVQSDIASSPSPIDGRCDWDHPSMQKIF